MNSPLVLTMTIDDWRKRLWDSLVDPTARARWWSATVALDPVPGGLFQDRWRDDSGKSQVASGQVVEVEPGKHITFRWHESYWRPEQQSQVTLMFAGDEGQTRLELTHAPLEGFQPEEWSAERTHFLEGWTELLLALRDQHHGGSTHSRSDIFIEKDLPVDTDEAWALLTQQERLAEWLCESAQVEPRSGGRFELFWEPQRPEWNSTQGCVVIACTPGQRLTAQWRGPEHLPLMHLPGSTVVFFTVEPKGKRSRVRLIHTGFGITPQWRAAREWQSMAWRGAFHRLEEMFG